MMLAEAQGFDFLRVVAKNHDVAVVRFQVLHQEM